MIPLLQARVDPAAATMVAETLASGYINVRERVAAFEHELAQYLGAGEVVCVNSCTSALVLALRLAGCAGGNVITTPMTFVATTTAIYQVGARPLWADVGELSCQIDALSVSDLLRRDHDRRVAAVVAVAWGGALPGLGALADVCRDYDRPLILDAAQAIGASYQGRPLTEVADFVCYSFAPTKHLTCGDGGALICRSVGETALARRMSWFGMRRWTEGSERVPSDQQIPTWGYKFNMNEIAASIGLANLRSLPAALDRSRAIASRFEREFPLERRLRTGSTPWFFTLFVEDVTAFIEHAKANGVAAGQPHRRNDTYAFATADCSSPRWLSNVEFAQAHYVAVPVGWWLSDADVDRVVAMVRAFPGWVR